MSIGPQLGRIPRRVSITTMTVLVGVVILIGCVVWAFAVQSIVTPACELSTPPPNVGLLNCSTPSPSADTTLPG